MVKYDVFDSVKEALDDGVMWGIDFLPLSEKALTLLKDGMVLKTDNGEYVQIIAMEGTDMDAKAKGVIVNGRTQNVR